MSTGDGMGSEYARINGAETPQIHFDPRDEVQYVELRDNVGKQQSLTVETEKTAWLVWPAFVTAVVVGSSASSITKSMDRVAPVSLAGWRHQLSSLLMLPGFLWQWSHLPKCERQRALHPISLGLHFLCALIFATHFATFFWSLNHTSMTHCLFLTCMSPIFVAVYTKLLGGTLLIGEVAGVLFGLAGALILVAGTSVEKDSESTHIGDLVALSSATLFAGYLTLGRRLRSWMPLFVFQFPVALVAAIVLGVTGILLEGWNESESGEKSGPFGWIRTEYLLGTILLAVGPGFLGYVGISVVLCHSSPLLLPTGMSIQPLLGSVLGWALGYSSIPGLWTCLGGLVALCGTLCVSYASGDHKIKLENTQHDHHSDDEYQKSAADLDEERQIAKPLLQSSELP